MSLSELLAQAQTQATRHFAAFAPLPAPHPKRVLFFAFTDGARRALLCRGAGDDLPAAWRDGAQRAQRLAAREKLTPRWLRIDQATAIEKLTWGELSARLARTKRNYFRLGLALDAELKHAFLEPELGAHAMLYPGSDQAEAGLNEKNFTTHARQRFGQKLALDDSPDAPVWLFAHEGVFLTDDPALAALPGDTPEDHHTRRLPGPVDTQAGWQDPTCLNAGRRQIQSLQADQVYALIDSSANFLARQVKKDGQFIYGHFPCFGRTIPTYNALRHASSVYSMLEAWELTRNDSLLAAIRRALDYLINTLIRHYPQADGRTLAFNLDINGEIKLGANAVSLLALVKYDELTGDTRHRPLMDQLALGIAHMQNPETGQFVHVLNGTDLSLKEAFRIVYYDGEAAFGLMRLYGLTRDPRWLAGVERAFDYFLQADHWQHHDHWLSYCANELTLYKPEEKYFRFGVQNIAGYLDFILERETTYPTLLELSMAFEAMLRRIESDHPHMRHVLAGLDLDKFHRALHHRAHYLLNGFFWPELAMYFAKPQSVVGSFFIRHHSFRVRIDDIEHYLSGYVAYWKMLGQEGAVVNDGPRIQTTHDMTVAGNADVELNLPLPMEIADAVSPCQPGQTWTAEQLAAVCNGKWLVPPPPGWFVKSVAISSEYINRLPGPTLFVGHDSIDRARYLSLSKPLEPFDRYGTISVQAKKLAGAIVGEAKELPQLPSGFPVLQVTNPIEALVQLGLTARQRYTQNIFAVTGTVGKSTTVDMLQSVLGGVESVLASIGGNSLMATMTVLASLSPSYRAAVFEVSHAALWSKRGPITRQIRPTVAVLLSITPAHMEAHGTLENLVRCKAKIFDGTIENGVAIINRDIPYYDIAEQKALENKRKIITYGQHPQANFRLISCDPSVPSFKFTVDGEELECEQSSIGEHIALNSLAIIAALQGGNLDWRGALPLLKKSGSPPKGRGEVINVPLSNGNAIFLNQAYNASPASMKAALEMLYAWPAQKAGRKLAILADMLELGDDSPRYHEEIAEYLKKDALDLAILVGERIHAAIARLPEGLNSIHLNSVEELFRLLPALLLDGDVVMLKGSNGTGLLAGMTAFVKLQVNHFQKLPVLPVTLPVDLGAEIKNGKLTEPLLKTISGGGSLHHFAACAWEAMSAAAKQAGLDMKISSAYRNQKAQEKIFMSRYSTNPPENSALIDADWPVHAVWQGQHWWLLPGKAPARVPGTSNHGWGLSVDIARLKKGTAVCDWLLENAGEFGFCWELQEDPWHLNYFPGIDLKKFRKIEDKNAEPTSPLPSVVGAVTLLHNEGVRGWAVHTAKSELPMVEMLLDNQVVRSARPRKKMPEFADFPCQGVAGFTFMIRPSFMAYIHSKKSLQFRVGEKILPIIENKLVPPKKKKPLQEFFSLKEQGWFVTKNGDFKLSVHLNQEWQEKILDFYHATRLWFKERYDLDLVITAGTLLGHVRQGDFISGDDDFDAAYFSKYSSAADVKKEMLEILRDLYAHNKVTRIPKFAKNFFGLRHPEQGVGMDIFPMWRTESHFYHSPHIGLPVANVITGEAVEEYLKGKPVLVPKQKDEFLSALYGASWRVPDPLYQWDTPPDVALEMRKIKLTESELGEWYWERFYSKNRDLNPSSFAELFLKKMPHNITGVIDLGCGNGRDSGIITGQLPGLGLDIAYSAIKLANEMAKTQELNNIEFKQINVCNAMDLYNALQRFKQKTKGPLAVYSRFLLNNLDEAGQKTMLDTLTNEIPDGSIVYFEFRSHLDAFLEKFYKNHYRRFINPADFVKKIMGYGCFELVYREIRQGLAVYKTEDPHIARLGFIKRGAVISTH